MDEVLEKVAEVVRAAIVKRLSSEGACFSSVICTCLPCHCATEITLAAIAALEATGLPPMPVEPTEEMVSKLYGLWLSPTANESRRKAYVEMVAVRPRLDGEGG